MSQIAGIFHRDGAGVTPEEAQLQLAPLATAPHDRQSAWREGPISLAHFALDIADEDALDRQPLNRGGCALVWDGTLFNRSELLGLLSLPDLPDSELVLQSWLRWGRECPGKLVGDFAFAVWDSREKTLFLARDRIGMRPVYYTSTGRLFGFASQIKGVRDLPRVDRSLDEEWVADYLSLTHLSREATAYRGIRRLPAAHWMSVSMGGPIRMQQYWRLRDEPADKFSQEQDYYDKLREVTKRAVHDRMPGREPVGSMLSGGLDSSTVTAFACEKARAEGRRLIAVSSVLPQDHPGPETDERRYIEAFLQRYPECEWHAVTAPGKHFLSDLDRLLEICDQPVRDPFHYVTTALVDQARDAGARVLMTGMGGDFFISSRGGHGVYARLLVELKWRRLWDDYTRARQSMPEFRFWKFFRLELLRPFVTVSLLARWLEALGLLSPPKLPIEAASRELLRRYDVVGRQRRRHRHSQYSAWRALAHTDERIMGSGAIAHALEYFSALGAGAGVVLSCPLLDHRVIAAVAHLPAELRRNAIRPRNLIRTIAEGRLPDLMRLRPDKGAFSPDTTRRASYACKQLRALDRYEASARELKGLLDWDSVKQTASCLTDEAASMHQDVGSITTIFVSAALCHLLSRMAGYENTRVSVPTPTLP